MQDSLNVILNLNHPTSSLTPERETKTGKNTDTHDLNNNNNTNQLPPLDSLAALSLSDPTRSLAYSYPPAPTYPPLTPTLHSSPITILSTPDKGRGVYATADLAPGTLIDISPVLLLSNEEYYGGGKEGEGKGVEGSVLRGYVFTWRGKEGGMALALGMGSLFNHSKNPNVSFELNPSTYTIHYRTFSSISAGDELCIFYGHKTRFDTDEPEEDEEESEDEGGQWGGLEGIGAEVVKRKEKNKWDKEIVPFENLEWNKVTALIDPEDQPLTTFDCWVIDIPARYSPIAFQFARTHAPNVEILSHVKRVRKSTRYTGTSDGDALVSVLLFPLHAAPSSFPEILEDSVLSFLDPKPYVLPVPSTIARTEAQGREWGKVWPVQMVHIREGPKALPRAKGWERVKKAWVRREGERVWKAALDAQKRGEHPIACHVTDTFNPAVHSPSSLPKTLVRAHDTRLSTHNILSHAAANAIDAVAILDRQGLRDLPLLPTLPAPYLLTGQTVFMSHEPCLLCSMSLLHSRIAQLYYVKRSPGSGGCGSLYSVHEDGGLNHRFEVWEWKGEEGGKVRIGEGLELLLDP